MFHFLQVTDYAIARRIVDLHARNKESVERFYSVDDMQRYLMFARQFKPKVGGIYAAYIFWKWEYQSCLIGECLLQLKSKVLKGG